MKKKLIIIFILILLVLGGFYILNQTSSFSEKPNNEVIHGNNIDNLKIYQKRYQDNKAINDDYLGYLEFESGLVMQDVVFASDYDEYLRTDWKSKEYSLYGTVFLDPYADLNSQNMTLYGHTSTDFPYANVFFTPLEELTKEDNYEKNRYVRLYLEDHYRRYDVAYVYHIPLDYSSVHIVPYGVEYMYTSFDDDALDYYLGEIAKMSFYDTKVKIEPKDKFMTFQTCVKGRNDLRLILVLKEIERVYYE